MAAPWYPLVPTVYGPSKQSSEQIRTSALQAGVPCEVEDYENVWKVYDHIVSLPGKPADVMVGGPLFRTVAHKAMVHHLWGQTRSLAEGRFAGLNGAPSRTIVGAKGIGKTTVLRAFASVCSVLFPSVVCVVFDYSKYGDEADPASSGSLLKVTATNLHKRGYLDRTPTEAPWGEALVNAIGPAGLRLLILVDEFDDLYRTGEKEKVRETTGQILANLALLGDQTTGLFCTFLCGSSSTIPQLVTRNATVDMYVEYPVLRNAPNLNGTKFRDIHIPSALPTAVGAIAELLQWPGLDPGLARLYAFFVGTAPRNVATVNGSAYTSANFDVLSADESYLGAKTLTDPRLKKLVSVIQNALREKNKALIQKLVVNRTLQFRLVCETTWEVEFKPCTLQEIVAAYADEKIATDTIFNDLFRLNHSMWIILDEVEASIVRNIYPIALYQLIKLELAMPQRSKAKEIFAGVTNKIVQRESDVSVSEIMGDNFRHSSAR